jgi:ABC-type sulfate transport system substrate-binding protein
MKKKRKFAVIIGLIVLVGAVFIVFSSTKIIAKNNTQAEIITFVKQNFNNCIISYEGDELKSVSGISRKDINKKDYEYILNLYACCESTPVTIVGENVLVIFK